MSTSFSENIMGCVGCFAAFLGASFQCHTAFQELSQAQVTFKELQRKDEKASRKLKSWTKRLKNLKINIAEWCDFLGQIDVRDKSAHSDLHSADISLQSIQNELLSMKSSISVFRIEILNTITKAQNDLGRHRVQQGGALVTVASCAVGAAAVLVGGP
eukprot:UN32206